jgi:hypothetical protein
MKNYSNEIAELEVQITSARRAQSLLETSNNEKVQDILNYHFNYFKEVEVKVRRDTATFHVKDEEGYNKEIFSLYFDERYYQTDPTLRISYYSSSTNSDFEIDRLILLGKVAQIIKRSSETILSEIKDARKSNLEEYNEIFKKILGYEKQIREYRDSEFQENKIQIQSQLNTKEGITFDLPQHIFLKNTYSPKIDKIRITEVKGKTCTVAIEMDGGSYKTTESRVNIDKLINQIKYYNIL